MCGTPDPLYRVFETECFSYRIQRSLHSILSARILLRLREDASQRQHLVTYTRSLGESFFDGVHEPGTRRQGKETTNWFGDAYSHCHVVDAQAPPARDSFHPT